MSKSIPEIIDDVMYAGNLKSIAKVKGKISIAVCPYCGNGKSKKPRASILYDSKKATYRCLNGGCKGTSLSLWRLAKKFGYTQGMADYMMYQHGSDGFAYDSDNDVEDVLEKPSSLNYQNIDVTENLEVITSNDNFKKVITCVPLDRKLKEYLYNVRKIPVDLSNKMLKNGNNGNLLIPYYNKTLEDVYYFQERTNKGQYYFLKIKGYDNELFDFKKIYNLYNVDESIPIIAFEGVFDTFFVTNSISIGGSKNVDILDKLKLFYNSEKIYYIQDNDKAGKESAIEYMENDGYVFMWYLFLRENNINTYIKDVNDLYTENIITKKLNFSKLEKYFTNKKMMINLI